MSVKAPVDLFVGIDFGMTCTGVAYSNTKQKTPRVIQNWPGKPLEVHNKVPSTLVYWTDGPSEGIVRDWGFKSQNGVEGRKEWLKRYLDPEHIDSLKETARKSRRPDSDTEDHDTVQKYYKDYMCCLYAHLSDAIQAKTGSWKSQRVEFVFSLPCTFEKPQIGQNLLALIKEAGFESGGARHSAELGLTEPEAAAVFTIKESAVRSETGTTILVCDAGGGTTDLAILQSATKDDEEPEWEALDVVEGRNVGSTNIDVAFDGMVESRLSAVAPALPDNTAWSMMHSSEFSVWKCTFGQDDSKDFTSFPITVPTVGSDFNHKQANIVNGKMQFSQADFRALFDPEVDALIKLISEQLESLKRSLPNKQLDYLVLSGGLGSSAYVQSRLKSKFERGHAMQILVSEEPQLAVVKGLVIDRVQRLSSGKAVLKSRKCRASYGVVLSTPYIQELHTGQECWKSLDGVTYVKSQIVWLIRKGGKIDPEKPIIKPAQFDFVPNAERRPYTSTIYMSFNDPHSLPTNTSHADAHHVCDIGFDLTKLSLDKFEARKTPSKGLLRTKKPYYRANFETKIIIGAADLRFEVWFNGSQYGEEHVSVDWA